MIKKEDLIGEWKSDSDKEYGEVSMHFNADDTLVYSVSENGKKQIINLIYWIEGGYLCTDQPSAPKVEKTEAEIKDNKLILNYDNVVVSFSHV